MTNSTPRLQTIPEPFLHSIRKDRIIDVACHFSMLSLLETEV